jgi:hypothetical protein
VRRRREAVATAARQIKDVEVELATMRERAAAAEQRSADLASQLQRLSTTPEREISQLRESQAATAAVLRQFEARIHEPDKPGSRARKSARGSARS